VLGVLALIFTALVTPWEVAFITASTEIDFLFVLNRIVDSIFFFDMLAQFFIMVPDDATATRSGGVRYETNRVAIARRYLRGWFLIDFPTTLLAVLDLLPFLTSSSDSDCGGGGGGGGALQQLKVLRVIRVLRLAKLLRLVRIPARTSPHLHRDPHRTDARTAPDHDGPRQTHPHWAPRFTRCSHGSLTHTAPLVTAAHVLLALPRHGVRSAR
jgi:hypothetical protein